MPSPAEADRRWNANRYYAQSLVVDRHTHVYYFDADGVLQELGKEQVRIPRPPRPPKRCIVREKECWVYGPDKARGLVEGECELVTKRVRLYV